jgi:LPXTG-site transpeptidase (sortase) family protein
VNRATATDRGRWSGAVLAAVALLGLAGLGGAATSGRVSAAGSVPSGPSARPTWRAAAEAVTPGIAPIGTADGGDAAPLVAPGPPTEVRIPRIGVDSTLETLGLSPTGELNPPRDFARAGWYAGGTAPGDVGPAVIAGHVDSRTGPAVFFRLRELSPGDVVQVHRDGHWLSFRVTATKEYPKEQFPTVAVYGPTPDPQLRLITCGGDFDRSRRSYYDNVVVYAVAG